MIADYSVYRPSRKERLRFSVILFCAVLGASYVFYASFIPLLLYPLIYYRAEKMYCDYLAERRKAALLLQFRDLLYSLSASLATGRHMAEALEEAEESLRDIYGGDSELLGEVKDMIRKMKETGESDLAVIEDFARRAALEDVEDFTEVFRACRETGGNLVSAVNKAATVIGEKINIEREIKAMVMQKKYEGRIITIMPVAIILFLQIMSPAYLQVMYSTAAGRILMSLALAAIVIAYFMIERITSIEV